MTITLDKVTEEMLKAIMKKEGKYAGKKIYLRKNQTNLYGTLNINDRDSALENILRFMDDEDDLDTTDPLDHFTEEQIDQILEKLDSLQAALEHGFCGTLTEGNELSVFLIPYCY